jgi:hypothetical protein
MRRKSWKVFHKTLFLATLQPLVDVYILTRRLLRGKCSLNDGAVSYSSEIKWFMVSFHLFICSFRCIKFFIRTHIYLNHYSLFICSCLYIYLLSHKYLFICTLLQTYYLFIFIYLYLCLFVLTRICIFIYILNLLLFVHTNLFVRIYLFTPISLLLYTYVFVFIFLQVLTLI